MIFSETYKYITNVLKQIKGSMMPCLLDRVATGVRGFLINDGALFKNDARRKFN